MVRSATSAYEGDFNTDQIGDHHGLVTGEAFTLADYAPFPALLFASYAVSLDGWPTLNGLP